MKYIKGFVAGLYLCFGIVGWLLAFTAIMDSPTWKDAEEKCRRDRKRVSYQDYYKPRQ